MWIYLAMYNISVLVVFVLFEKSEDFKVCFNAIFCKQFFQYYWLLVAK